MMPNADLIRPGHGQHNITISLEYQFCYMFVVLALLDHFISFQTAAKYRAIN